MPIYEYVCAECRHKFEKLQSMASNGEATCPECGKEAKKALSVFAAISISTSGEATSVAGTGGGCGGCAGGACACSHSLN